MEELKRMKQSLMSCVSSQIHGNLHQVDTKQLGQAIDMIKDLSEAVYYCTVTEAMEKSQKQAKEERYYSPYRYDDVPRMYYTSGGGRSGGNNSGNGGNNNSSNGSGGRRMYVQNQDWDWEHPNSRPMGPWMRDHREGQSPMQRKTYMEGKELHQDKMKQVKQLQKYMNSLSKDITEMIQDASPEQKETLKQKLTTLTKMIV